MLISLIHWPQWSEVLHSGGLQVGDPADPPTSSLFNTAGHLVEACAEAIQEVLGALTGEEGSGRVWRNY